MRSVIRAPASSLGLALLPFAAVAAESVERTAPAAPIDSLTISAARTTTPLADLPVHATVLDAAELDAAPARTLDQVLRSVQGLNFTGVPAAQTDPTAQQTRMRGLGNAKTLVLLDGVPLHDPFFLTTQWFKVPLATIERVEVLRGGYSSLWGDMAVAGVVNLVSRRIAGDEGAASVGVASRGSRDASVTLAHAIGDHLGLQLSAERSRLEGWQTTPAEHLWRFPQKGPTDAVLTNASLRLTFADLGDFSGWLRAGWHVQDQDIAYRFGSNEQRSPDASAGIVWKLAERSLVRVNAWAQSVRFDKYNGASCWWQATGTRCPSSIAVTLAQAKGETLQYYSQYGELRYRERGASVVWSRPLALFATELQAGSDWRRLSGTDAEAFYLAPTVLTAPQGNLGSRTSGAGVQTFTGAFAQLAASPLSGFDLRIAARLDRWTNTDRASTRATAGGIVTGGAFPDSDRSAFNPSVAARWQIDDAVALRAAAYRAFRAPGFNNTLRSFGATQPTIANPELEPETLRGWETGTDVAIGAWKLGATYFRYAIDDQIATFRVNGYATAPLRVRTFCSDGGANLTLCGGSANFYTNDQDGESHGIELDARWQVRESLTIGAEYSRTRATLTRRGPAVTDPLHVQLAGLPRDIAQLRIDWRRRPGLRARVEARYIGPLFTDTTSTANTVYGQGSVVVVDASAGFRLAAGWDVTAAVTNALGREYSENTYAFTQPFNRTLSAPRTLSAGLRWSY